MVVCKYFQQGNCRFGQYCRFEHINNFDNSAIRNKTCIDGKNIALVVAEDVLAAERGGQWILSCFGPFKEQPCIPGMEDVSPEEVRWQMYQAQKDGTVDQVKLQFQQMCQEMKVKHEALKHPTTDTVVMLEKIQKINQEKPNFPFGASPLTSGTSTTSNVFGSATTSNNFTGSFNSTSGSTVFGNAQNSVFGGKSTFGNNSNSGNTNSIFANAVTTSASMFGGSSKVATSAFGSAGQTTQQTFFSGSSQPAFGQTSFNSASQPTNIFARPVQTSQQSNSPFGGTVTTSGNSIFANSFTNAQLSQANTNSPFGSTTSTSAGNSPSIFGQAKTAPAFGKASVFGNIGSTTIFNTQSIGVNNVFGSSFGNGTVSSQNTVSPFATVVPTTTAMFAPSFNAQQQVANFPAPFGTVAKDHAATTQSTVSATFGNPQTYSMFANSNNSNIATVSTTPGIFSPFDQKGSVNSSSPFITVTATVDSSMYSIDGALTDDEKTAYLEDKFVYGKIPLKPPIEELK